MQTHQPLAARIKRDDVLWLRPLEIPDIDGTAERVATRRDSI
jgi:hypothetical protein